MLAVVLGHIATPLTNFIFSWHMPAFFFLSGFFINIERSMRESIKKEAKRLIVPFFVFGVLGLIAEIIKRKLFPGFAFAVQDFSLVKEIQGLFFLMDFTHMHQYGFVLWFLMALFWGKLILQLLLKFIKNKIVIGLICLALFFVLANQNFILPFSMDKGLFSLIWLFAGYFYYNYCIKEKKQKFDVWLAILATIALIIFPIPMTNIAVKVAQNPISSLLYGSAVIVLLATIFKIFGDKYLNNQFLENWGKNSLVILVLHPYANNFGYIIAGKFFNGNWGVNFVISVIMLIVLLLSIEYVKKALKNSRFTYSLQSAGTN
jgi:fucose 4-O-acetylase-like acetyltransferase